MLRDRLERMRFGMDTERYHTFYTNRKDTVAHHSHGVIGFCLLLMEGMPAEYQFKVIRAAYAHDLPEGGMNPMVALGDMPAPAKRAIAGMREAYASAEIKVMVPLAMAWEHALDDEQHRIMKLADNFDGLFFAIAEFRSGNVAVRSTYEAYVSYLSEQGLSGVALDIFNIAQDWWEDILAGPYWSKPYVRK